MNIREAKTLVYGVDYQAGDIGFVSHDAFISKGIRWFTRFWRFKNPAVSHVFVVVGDGKLIEANYTKVEVMPISEYTEDPDYTFYLRKPAAAPWQEPRELGQRIAAEAMKYEGLPYGKKLIVADAISYCLMGRLLNGLTRDAIDAVLTNLADTEGQMICDKLAVVAMQAQPELRPLGTLKLPAAQNNPQRLFGDEEVFQPDVVMVRGRK